VTLFERHWRAIAVGFAAAAFGVILVLGLDDAEQVIFAGVALAAIAGIYLGFAIADGRTSAIAIQLASVLAFAIVAYIGIEQDSKALIGAGWIAHGFWDAIHHEGHGPTDVKTWYPPFCATADLVVGVPLVLGLT
jgi:hypothetical protein